jgi:HlyD family secretion protein
MKRSTKLGTAAAAAALLALLAWAFAPRPLPVELASAATAPFETGIDEDARTRLRERYLVSAPLAGRLARITLREGDAVEAGAVVAQLAPVLSPMLDERSTLELDSRAQAAQANVLRATAGVERARVALAQARSELQRTEQLAQQGFVAATQLDTQRLVEQAALKDVDAAMQTQHVASHELQVARAALQAVRATGATAGSFPLRSPVAGRVLKVIAASEASVAPGAPLLEIGDTTQLEVVAELLTGDAMQAPAGTLVRIERWGGAGTLDGRVRRVEPAAFTKVSALGVEEQRVNVLIDLVSPASRWASLGDGFRVGVRVITLRVDAALQVPVSAVFPWPGGAPSAAATASAASGAEAAVAVPRWGVFVADGGRARLRQVQLGGRNGQTAWIRDGLAAGTQVIVYPAAEIRDGVRIQPRKV